MGEDVAYNPAVEIHMLVSVVSEDILGFFLIL